MQHSKSKVIALVLTVSLFFCCWAVQAAEIDLLVEKLVEKGILSEGEAQQLLTETREEARREIAQGKNEVLPKWLQTTKFSGDLRIRYQGETKSGDKHRDRGRFRLRYGFDCRPNEQMKVGFKMATGENKTNGPEQTSTNQTFTNSFQNKDIWIDRAFIEYTPFSLTDLFLLKDMTLIGGKFANPFFTTDMVWDSDINPEGGVIKFTPSIGGVETFLVLGFMPLGEDKDDSNDPKLYAGQIGFSPKIMGRSSKFAVALYSYDDIKGMAWNTYSKNYTPTINNTLDGSNLKYDYNIVEFNAEYSPIDLAVFSYSLPVVLQYSYVSNEAKHVSEKHTAWLAGFKLGK
ncbi:MAG: putative porin, partial [Candidatus Omnitrophica bacterium]|nr:putative porin [Candidatus Omnitrophota bacterium]